MRKREKNWNSEIEKERERESLAERGKRITRERGDDKRENGRIGIPEWYIEK